MTRGKYAARASLRREDAAVQSEIGSYQHHVRRLTAENKDLRAALDEERHSRKQEARFLKAMRDEGLSPELMALREELERQRAQATRSKAEAKRQTEVKNKMIDFAIAILHNLTGCTSVEALESVLTVISGERRLIADTHGRHKLTPEGVYEIQGARGRRSSAKVRAELDRVVLAAQAEMGRRTRPGPARARAAEQ